MRRKKLSIVIIAAAIALAVLIVFWLQSEQNVPKEVEPSELTVAALVPQEDEFSNFVLFGMETAAKEYGVGRCLSANSNNNEEKEVEFINTYLSLGVDGVAMQPVDGVSSLVTLKNASDKGLAVAIEGLDISDTEFIVGTVISSNYDLGVCGGQVAADFIADELEGHANIGVICYDSQYLEPSTERIRGYLDAILEKNPDVEIVDRQDAWVQDMAVTVAEDMLSAHPEINVFICANDGGTIGTVMAVKNMGRAGDCFVFGIDCGEQQLRMLLSEDNILQAVAAQDAYGIGYGAMQYLIEYLLGNEKNMGKTTYLQGTVIERGDNAGIEEYRDLLRSLY